MAKQIEPTDAVSCSRIIWSHRFEVIPRFFITDSFQNRLRRFWLRMMQKISITSCSTASFWNELIKKILSRPEKEDRLKRQTRQSPKSYLTSRRMHETQIMNTAWSSDAPLPGIQSKYYTQREIAERCGFSDVEYFRCAFQAKTGQTIAEYESIL